MVHSVDKHSMITKRPCNGESNQVHSLIVTQFLQSNLKNCILAYQSGGNPPLGRALADSKMQPRAAFVLQVSVFPNIVRRFQSGCTQKDRWFLDTKRQH